MLKKTLERRGAEKSPKRGETEFTRKGKFRLQLRDMAVWRKMPGDSLVTKKKSVASM